ncbi:MAG: hypothetical protein Q8787_02680, partial [Sweet potato little leaf phytoplasma]|nr:hypothetical protein [Sweet potato little leaf phytoplasma]
KKIILAECKFCKGVGMVKSEHKVTLNIPAGVESGMRLKSPNQELEPSFLETIDILNMVPLFSMCRI